MQKTQHLNYAVLVQARGKANTMSFEGKDFVRLENVQYTNCVEGQDDFYIKAKELELDHATGIGTASNASLVFKGVPFFYLPHLSFPITIGIFLLIWTQRLHQRFLLIEGLS